MNNYILSISDIIKAVNDSQCVTAIINGVYYDFTLDNDFLLTANNVLESSVDNSSDLDELSNIINLADGLGLHSVGDIALDKINDIKGGKNVGSR